MPPCHNTTGHLHRVFGENPPGFALEGQGLDPSQGPGQGYGQGQGVAGVGATPARNALHTSLHPPVDLLIAPPQPVAGYTTPSTTTQYMGVPTTSRSARHSPPKTSDLRPSSATATTGGAGGTTTALTVSPGRCTLKFPPSPPSAPLPLRVTYTSPAVPTPAYYTQHMSSLHSGGSGRSSSNKQQQQQYRHVTTTPRSPSSLALVCTPPPVAVPALMQLLNERDVTRLELDQCLVLLDEVAKTPPSQTYITPYYLANRTISI